MASPVPQLGGQGQQLGALGAAEGEEGGSTDRDPEDDTEGADECLLTSLPDAVVAGLWPAELVLEGFAICSKGLSRALRSAPRVLVHHRNLFHEEAGAVAGLLEAMVDMKLLDLGGNEIGARGATALAGALAEMTGLEHLSLGQRYWTDHEKLEAEGMMAIAPSLPPSLLHLNLSRNSFGAQGATALAGAFRGMTGLQHLDVQRNKLGDEGMMAIMPTLPPSLLHLNLNFSDLLAQGSACFGKGTQVDDRPAASRSWRQFAGESGSTCAWALSAPRAASFLSLEHHHGR